MDNTKPKGTRIIIRSQGEIVGGLGTGLRFVHTAHNWGDRDPNDPKHPFIKDDWYIEIEDEDGNYTGYWKQGMDGGTVEFL